MANQRVRAQQPMTVNTNGPATFNTGIAKSLPAPVPNTIQGLVDETFHALSAARASAHRILVGLRGPDLSGDSQGIAPRDATLKQDLTDNLDVARDLHRMMDEITDILSLSHGQALQGNG